MNTEMVLSLAEKGVYTTLIVCAPLLLLALGIGLIVSIFQATTQIQEQTLAFVPKIAGVLIGLIFFGPWMLEQMITYTSDIFTNLTRFVG
ncbi:flagellar biosynthesis protein FliQ [Domibacillus sp. DTU_2020_1001157_1_SI_ALB_TIR_016]|uniref:flagellar biosynthesis protein FliQ n=1 Tax=Domibacillus sp. DTU_2020_1001157_1_SI_ALB_TIR_016 TaxID=3077789 RepID=UPI0028E1E35B|nr:flagellar biosynthesis protein FliQ [Domibacillus sp. DTU_2020_1001157_1_SI_ALB_TIR_016]WNS79715.1 flagellar biosynthesis protein FliQ [Domibacillus sp. DTU_2020_1001157_1_SI_ALB_TIR_016]